MSKNPSRPADPKERLATTEIPTPQKRMQPQKRRPVSRVNQLMGIMGTLVEDVPIGDKKCGKGSQRKDRFGQEYSDSNPSDDDDKGCRCGDKLVRIDQRLATVEEFLRSIFSNFADFRRNVNADSSKSQREANLSRRRTSRVSNERANKSAEVDNDDNGATSASGLGTVEDGTPSRESVPNVHVSLLESNSYFVIDEPDIKSESDSSFEVILDHEELAALNSAEQEGVQETETVGTGSGEGNSQQETGTERIESIPSKPKGREQGDIPCDPGKFSGVFPASNNTDDSDEDPTYEPEDQVNAEHSDTGDDTKSTDASHESRTEESIEGGSPSLKSKKKNTGRKGKTGSKVKSDCLRGLQCLICKESFSNQLALHDHKKTHAGEERFKCQLCNKRFTRRAKLQAHKLIHLGERLHECNVCKRTFSRKADLKRHERIHTGEKPYECELCHKGFNQSQALRRHERTHTGERPYKCNVCEKTFAQSAHLRDHERTHTGEQPYICRVCNQAFATKKHERNHTRQQP